ncbi:MAG: 3-dehydroquinate synthase [Alphaproteobacteria bacterium]|nr:3-dehydroquinate synthase [Alphaproteobacteria bacterium]
MIPIRTVEVALGARRYPVHVGPGLLDRLGAEVAALKPARRVVIVSDENVAKLYLARAEASLKAAGLTSTSVVLPPGEGSKSLATFGRLVETILERGIERGTLLVALGGGVIGDLAGFAAAVLLRGIGCVQVPTTLLAQVDSAVGGKTGIDSRHGKNLIGAFHQPRLVLADTATLETLPRRELLAGYAEVVKYGLIDDAAFFAWLEENGPAALSDGEAARIQAVAQCVAAKARIVAGDEREQGARALLNLGHTFAHALEAELEFAASLLHGEAVAIGLVLAFALSVRLGLCPPADGERIRRHLARVGLPVTPPPGLARTKLIERMRLDKKVADGKLRFVLARGIGQAFISDAVPADALAAALDEALAVPA